MNRRKSREILKAETLGELLNYLAPSLKRTQLAMPHWPPDVFAIVASILFKSGAYRIVLDDWPPKPPEAAADWAGWIEDFGLQWRQCWNASKELSEPVPPALPGLPTEITAWWSTVINRRKVALTDVASDEALSQALLQLCAAADAASGSVGTHVHGEKKDRFGWFAEKCLRERAEVRGSTLCLSIDSSRLRVLPKFHTPQTGITMRSLTHNLALCPTEEVTPHWYTVASKARHRRKGADERMLNVLLVPWPREIRRNQFQTVDPKKAKPLTENHGFLSIRTDSDLESSKKLSRLYEAAIDEAGHIDLIVLPELALLKEEYDDIRSWNYIKDVFLIVRPGGRSGILGADAHQPRYGRPQPPTRLPTVAGRGSLERCPQSAPSGDRARQGRGWHRLEPLDRAQGGVVGGWTFRRRPSRRLPDPDQLLRREDARRQERRFLGGGAG